MLLDQMLLHVPCPVFWKDVNSAFLGCNKLFLSMSGFSDYSELIGKKDEEFSWRQYGDDYARDDQYVMTTGESITKIERIPLPDRTIIAETTKAPLIKDGKIIGVLGICLDITDRIEKERLQQEKLQEQESLAKLAAQVAHDIRSPLTAMNTILQHLPQIPEAQRLMLRNAASRINDIANNMLERYKNSELHQEDTRLWLLAPVVESMVSEKRLQLENSRIQLDSTITAEGFAAFAHFNLREIKRLLSNLLNNAIEAFAPGSPGKILVSLTTENDTVVLTIADNGQGIPQDKLDDVFKSGMTTKAQGSGLGLAHAQEFVNAARGQLSLQSTVGEGTTLCIRLPKAATPDWFVSSIQYEPGSYILILDDDQSIHDAWEQRLKGIVPSSHIIHFKHSTELKARYGDYCQKPFQILSDYELIGESETGLGVLESLNRGQQSILVTSHYENLSILARCQAAGIRLLPKNLVTYVPINSGSDSGSHELASTHIDCVFIDDLKLLRDTWEMVADCRHKKILTFASPADFDAACANLDKATPIYIDSHIGEDCKGEVFAKTLFERGFTELYLATGYSPSDFPPMPWIKQVTGKKPPF